MGRLMRKAGLGSLVAISLVLSAASYSAALEPPDAGEIAALKHSGELAARLDNARAIGNHRIDAYRLDRAVSKARRTVLSQQGVPPSALDQAAPLATPPTGWRGMPTTGAVKMFVLLVDFSDYPAYNTNTAVNSALFGDGSLIPTNAAPYESLASYYKRSSYNLLSFSDGVTLGWYRPAYTRASMSLTTTARETLIKEAITSFDAAGQDFSQFDNNADGKIDYFAVVWTGPDNGWANFWWGYQTSFGDGTFTVDGKSLGKYSWQWEYRSGSTYAGPFTPKVIIHETGHALGLPDYYDYDGTLGPDGGVGGLDMMDGNWGDHNAFSKWVLDWLTPTVVASDSQSITLNPTATAAEAVLVMPGATASDPFREFFIAQNRYRTGNDPANYPTNGMLIWHVDATLVASLADYLYDNSYTTHKLLKLMQADGLDRIENNSASADAAMYYVAGKTLTPVSTPSSVDYEGLDSRVNVTGIASSGQQMSATFGIDAVSTLKALTVTKSGADGGTVTSAPAGISCGGDCSQSYAPGASVTLTVKVSPGAVFTGWSGGGCSGVGACVVTLETDVEVTAAFTATVILDENFDAIVQPTGWARHDYATGGWWWFMDDTGFGNTGGSGGYVIGATYDSGNPDYDIDLTTASMDVSAYACVGLEFKTDVGEPTADVDVSVNGAAGPWTNVWRKSAVYAGPATVNVDISAAVAGSSTAVLRFHHYGSDLWWLIDDVRVLASSVCSPAAPTDVLATTGNAQATVSFAASSSGGSPVTGYTVTSNPAGGVDQDAGTTALSHLVTGLSNGTVYTFTVEATNALGTSLASAASNSVLPGSLFYENFDAVTPPDLPSGWQSVVTSGTDGAWSANASSFHPSITPHSGSAVVSFNSWTALAGHNAALVTSAYSLAGVTDAKVSFWMYRDAQYPSNADKVEVSVNTAAGLTGATLLGTVNRAIGLAPAVATSGWYRYEFDVPVAFSGSAMYLIMAGTNAYGNDINIDDIGVIAAADPGSPTVTSATSTTADGFYKAGAPINVTVTFSTEISSSAGLTINLDSGGSVSTGALSGVTSFSGTYTIADGEASADLSIGTITGTITDAAAKATVNPTVPAGQNIADAKAIVVDTAAPTGSVQIKNDAVWTNTTAVTLNLAASDIGGSGLESMRFRTTTAEAYSAWEPYQATTSWTLVGTAGTIKVYAQFIDKAGNLSDANPSAAGAQGYTDAIAYDPTAPTGSVLINNGAVSTGSTAVTLNLTAGDAGGSGVASMRFRATTVEPYSDWEPYDTTRAWTLTSGLGTKKVYAQFKDQAGNLSDANPAATGAQGYVDAIELGDTTAPTGLIQINAGAASTGSTAVTLNLVATDTGGSGLASMRFRNSTAEPYSAWEDYGTTKDWTLTVGAGVKKVYVQFKDAADNLSDANPGAAGAQGYTDSITLNP